MGQLSGRTGLCAAKANTAAPPDTSYCGVGKVRVPFFVPRDLKWKLRTPHRPDQEIGRQYGLGVRFAICCRTSSALVFKASDTPRKRFSTGEGTRLARSGFCGIQSSIQPGSPAFVGPALPFFSSSDRVSTPPRRSVPERLPPLSRLVSKLIAISPDTQPTMHDASERVVNAGLVGRRSRRTFDGRLPKITAPSRDHPRGESTSVLPSVSGHLCVKIGENRGSAP
jgi:hypothetical protein